MTLRSAPRVSVDHCARAVETRLTQAGVVLTMGGEPTFVPRQGDGAEWSVDALGPTKLRVARALAGTLLAGRMSGAVVLEAPGKRYPGETLPRWSLQVHARTDGEVLWRDSSLLRHDDARDDSLTSADAEKLAQLIAGELQLDAGVLVQAREPGPDGSPGPICGFVLPLDEREGRWITDRWPYPEGHVTLEEEGRWIGLRLPLGELPPTALRRALSAEIRGGQLAVFIPPLLFPAYARLIAAIERSVARLGRGPVVLAGYAPPPDTAFEAVGLTPDPGVLEINLPPCRSWTEYRDWLDALYAAADSAGLCARKLHFNGRVTGTGGGAHVCFGGPTPLESPFLTRPDLIPSVLRYWQRHPALSYVFSGQYVGPTSQAPRPDEAMPGRLEELELACRGAEIVGRSCDLSQLDRLYRHLLSDGGGNTHRTEVSVDKLWNPLMPNGCLGLLEWRAFETLPDAQSLARVGLFIRTILAHLLTHPCREPFIPWGARLHDRFFLPSFLWLDLVDLCNELASAGLPFDPAWLREAWEFRFPRLGQLSTPAGCVEVRQALEAWPVLSEQDNGTITSRVVDSSLDRLEFSLTNPAMAASGHLLVNGVQMAFRREQAVCAAGVRFRAFALPTSLHPHVPAQAPLCIEWLDASTRTVTARAWWHSWHPRGEAYAGLPVDETDAAARRAARWCCETNITAEGAAARAAACVQEDHEYTLDLRRLLQPPLQGSAHPSPAP